MNFKVTKEFPCGYKYSFDYDGWSVFKPFNIETVCPLHGKSCRRRG